jgi:hypothetical protein
MANNIGRQRCSHGLGMADLRRVGRHVDVGRLARGGSVLLGGADAGGERCSDFRRARVFSGGAALGVLKVGAEHEDAGKKRRM